ncbi:hypothetical protein BKA66DRAFT_204804 [Pyrenochaeta sp. MPI-SDFR-AT-0127]|nr:hypothetical protein BKA66DRAFT_204804 [Pyrenochaeta sp. MPI-SDFR-AT-0127]
MANMISKGRATTGLLDLPNELILEIADLVHSQSCLNRLLQANKRLYQLLSDALLERNVREGGSSAVVWAFSNMRIDTLSRLQHYGANLYDPRSMPSLWNSLMNKAAGDGNIVMVEILIALGVDPLRYTRICMPYMTALGRGRDEIAKLFITFLPSLDFPIETNGRTALHAACGWHRGEIVRHLLSLGADANLKASGTRLSAFDELLGEDGVELWGHEPEDKELRDAAFNILVILLENGAEPDNEAYARGATSSDPSVRLLFCNREVNVGQGHFYGSKRKVNQEAVGQRTERESTQNLNNSQDHDHNHRSAGSAVFPDPPRPMTFPSTTVHASGAARNQPLAEQFPPLISTASQGKTRATLSTGFAEVNEDAPKQLRIPQAGEIASLANQPKSKKTRNRRWQRLWL